MLRHPVPSPCNTKTKKVTVLVLYVITIQYTNIEKVASLNHEIFDHSVERSILESGRYTTSFKLSRAKLSKIFSCLWHNIGKQFDDDSTNFLVKRKIINQAEKYLEHCFHLQYYRQLYLKTQLDYWHCVIVPEFDSKSAFCVCAFKKSNEFCSYRSRRTKRHFSLLLTTWTGFSYYNIMAASSTTVPTLLPLGIKILSKRFVF